MHVSEHWNKSFEKREIIFPGFCGEGSEKEVSGKFGSHVKNRQREK